jgi:hypothetical protein
MDNEMIERVAKAICEQLFGPYDPFEAKEAPSSPSGQSKLAAIEAVRAMREPTDHMYECLASKNIMYKDNSSYGIWTTYIDAIVGE